MNVLYFGSEMLKSIGIIEVARDVVAPIGKLVPLGLIDWSSRKLFDIGCNLGAEKLVVAFTDRHADDRKILREKFEGLQIVEGREEFSLCEVS